jgi:integrase/recombinase XerD
MEMTFEGREIGAELAWARPAAITRTLNLAGLMEQFLTAQDIREVSRRVYRNGLERFWGWLEGEQIAQPDREDVLRFKVHLQECGLTANTVNVYLVAVKRFFCYLEGMRLYPDIGKNVKGVKAPRHTLRESPTTGQVKEILERLDLGTVQGKRDYAMINLMARTGLRTIEVIRADVGDMKQKGDRMVLYVHGKGRDSKDEFVILTEAAERPIREYLKARGNVQPEDPLFTSLSDRNSGQRLTTATIRKVTRELFKLIGIDKPRRICAHSLRHFAITTAIRGGAPIEQTQAMARHASSSTTMGYYHNLDRLEHAAELCINF